MGRNFLGIGNQTLYYQSPIFHFKFFLALILYGGGHGFSIGGGGGGHGFSTGGGFIVGGGG